MNAAVQQSIIDDIRSDIYEAIAVNDNNVMYVGEGEVYLLEVTPTVIPNRVRPRDKATNLEKMSSQETIGVLLQK